MIQLFRTIGLLEGITTLALFLVAMPAKYWFGYPDLVPPVGMIHGVAFVIYLLAMVICLWGRGFSAWEWARTTIASFFPFGTFLNDPLLKRKQMAAAAV
jgi:integral membrane protein